MPHLVAVLLKRAKLGPMDSVSDARLVAGAGLLGNANQGGRRQVTLLSLERWAEVTAALGRALPPATRRANLILSGIDLEESRGRVLRVGECRLLINGETRPCERMEQAAAGLRAIMEERWGGGAYAEALDDGIIRVGDAAAWEA
jgi:MOSC domain-containing protein YiiM